MSANQMLTPTLVEALDTVAEVRDPIDPNELSLEALMLLIHSERLQYLNKQSLSAYEELKMRQEDIETFHKLLGGVNANQNKDGSLDWSKHEEMQTHLQRASELGLEFNFGKADPFKMTSEERERFVENIRMSLKDLEAHNEMLFQEVSRLNQERFESFQLAKAIWKPLHEDKVNKARAIAGR